MSVSLAGKHNITTETQMYWWYFIRFRLWHNKRRYAKRTHPARIGLLLRSLLRPIKSQRKDFYPYTFLNNWAIQHSKNLPYLIASFEPKNEQPNLQCHILQTPTLFLQVLQFSINATID